MGNLTACGVDLDPDPETRRRKQDEFRCAAVASMPAFGQGRMLDIGAGAGHAMEAAREAGWRCWWVDSDPAVAEYLTSRGWPGWREDHYAWVFRGAREFDLIWCKGALSTSLFKNDLPALGRWLDAVVCLLGENATAIVCPHWSHDHKGNRLYDEGPFLEAFRGHGWRRLPFIQGHNQEPHMHATFVYRK